MEKLEFLKKELIPLFKKHIKEANAEVTRLKKLESDFYLYYQGKAQALEYVLKQLELIQ